MDTPWGELPVSDGHVHLFSHGFFSLLTEQRRISLNEGAQILGWQMPPEDPSIFATQWALELDKAGVDRAVLMASLPGDLPSAVAAVRAYPQRFIGAAMVDPRRASTPLPPEIRMACLFPALHGYAMHDPAVTAFVEASADRVIFVHCGILSIGVRRKLGLASSFDLRFSNPVDLHGLALRFPATRFVVPHFGAGFWREALMLADQCDNVWLDTSSTNSWMKLQPAEVGLAAVFRRTWAVTRRLVFGTDSSYFPRGWHRGVFDAQVAAIAAAGIDEAGARAILQGNFNRLFT